MKNVRYIHEEDVTWSEFEWLFKKKYFSERYLHDRAKQFYELNMGCMTDDEYTSRFLDLLSYVPYFTGEKAKIQSFISGLPIALKDRIEFNEPRSLEESIQKLSHFYEQPKSISKTKPGSNSNVRNKVKWYM